jgi:hypothetical protein
MVFISFGYATDILFDSLTFSFGKSFLTGPPQPKKKGAKIKQVIKRLFLIFSINSNKATRLCARL